MTNGVDSLGEKQSLSFQMVVDIETLNEKYIKRESFLFKSKKKTGKHLKRKKSFQDIFS